MKKKVAVILSFLGFVGLASGGQGGIFSITMPNPADGNGFIEQTTNSVRIHHHEKTLDISLGCPRFVFAGGEVGAGVKPVQINGKLESGEIVHVTFDKIKLSDSTGFEVKLFLQWFPQEHLVRKWVQYRVTGSDCNVVLNEIVFDKYEASRLLTPMAGVPPQSFPLFFDGFFLGIEYPAASTRVEKGEAILAHRPDVRLSATTWRESRKAVYGVAKPNHVRERFVNYVEAHRSEPKSFFTMYATWWTMPILFDEGQILNLMADFKKNLSDPYNVIFDAFNTEVGCWDPCSIWELNQHRFPNGFRKMKKMANNMGMNLGLWVSPSSCYNGIMGVTPQWLHSKGYETLNWSAVPGWTICCIAGPNYGNEFIKNVSKIAYDYDLRHMKIDGFILDCPDANHGHLAGAMSSEALIEAGVCFFESVRKSSSKIWIETTCFGNASPWWLFYVNSTTGLFGDDAPAGRVPCPMYRQSYTSARDFYNLRGAVTAVVPIAAQEVLGLVHQSKEDFTDDAIVTIMRGNAFLSVYLDPRFMNERRWNTLAQLITWAKKNNSIFENTTVLLPDEWKKNFLPLNGHNGVMPRQVYGYAHGSGDQSLIMLRNPWIRPCEYELVLDENIGLTKRDGQYDISSIYPQERVYQKRAGFGETVKLPIAPYETIVLSISTKAVDKKLPDVKSVIGDKIKVASNDAKARLVEYEPALDKIGAGSLDLAADCNSAVEISAAAKIDLKSTEGRLLILCESNSPDPNLFCKIQVNGKNAEVYADGAGIGWRSTGAPNPENWVFFWVPLSKGVSDAAIELTVKDKNVKVSGWVWVYKQTSGTTGGQLPAPEIMSLDAVKIFDVIDCNKAGGTILKKPHPITRINGVYLDSMEKVSGTFERNRCMSKSPMKIQGLKYTRGFGTTTTGVITVPLDGTYSRFTATVGIDSSIATDGLDKTEAVFIVKLDGKKAWKSKPVMVRDQPQQVDVDIAGAKTLELQVMPVETRGSVSVNCADWANAAVLH